MHAIKQVSWAHLIGCPLDDQPNPPQSFDCYTLVTYVRREFYGLDTPLVVPEEMVTIENLSMLLKLHLEKSVYVPTDAPKLGDIVLFNEHHIGVVVDGGVLSTFYVSGIGSVRYFEWARMRRWHGTAKVVTLA